MLREAYTCFPVNPQFVSCSFGSRIVYLLNYQRIFYALFLFANNLHKSSKITEENLLHFRATSEQEVVKRILSRLIMIDCRLTSRLETISLRTSEIYCTTIASIHVFGVFAFCTVEIVCQKYYLR
jgi:hypothetical protein